MRKRIYLILGMGIALSLGAANVCLQSYQAADQAYQAFVKDRSKTKYHQNWEKMAEKFARIGMTYPDCEKADDAWLKAGKVWLDCYQISRSRSDQDQALAALAELLKRYPKSNLADDALYYRAEIYLSLGERDSGQAELGKILAGYPAGDRAAEAKKRLSGMGVKSGPAGNGSERVFSSQSTQAQSAAPGKAPLRNNDAIALMLDKSDTSELSGAVSTPLSELLRIRYWSAPSYTRVVMDLSRKAGVSDPKLLPADPGRGVGPRIYFDLLQTRLSPEFRNQFQYQDNCYELMIGDGLLRRARAGQNLPEVVRIVLDLQSISDFQLRSLPGENGTWRIVVDIFGERKPDEEIAPAPAPNPQPGQTPAPSPTPVPTPNPLPMPLPKPVAKAFPPVIVIDAGHGGKDPGALGKRNQEKIIALNIAKYLEQELKKKYPEAKVVLTRRDDRFLELEERTAKANALEADLANDQQGIFISIHVNATRDGSAYGIETYYLDNTTDRASLKLAARENFVSEEVMEQMGSDVNKILADLTTNSKVSQSVPLARSVQENLVDELAGTYSSVKNLGVKKAPFWVLTGARMPCVLVEVGFISNQTEEKRLASTGYQKAIAKGIADGVNDWLKNPQALLIP